jgi:hypothetical protein
LNAPQQLLFLSIHKIKKRKIISVAVSVEHHS